MLEAVTARRRFVISWPLHKICLPPLGGRAVLRDFALQRGDPTVESAISLRASGVFPWDTTERATTFASSNAAASNTRRNWPARPQRPPRPPRANRLLPPRKPRDDR